MSKGGGQMAGKPFEPVGDRARWRVIYDILRGAPAGTVITYEKLAGALALDPVKDRHAIQMSIRRASDELERKDKRAIDVERGQGYKVVPATANLGLARRHQRKAGRALARGYSKAVNVDLSGVDPEVRKALEITAQAFSLQMDMNRRFAAKQSEMEQAVADITTTQAADRQRTAEEVAALHARIERLERGMGA
jgi:hypothetical protein